MVTKQEFNESKIVRKNKVCTGAVIFDWIPPAFFNMTMSLFKGKLVSLFSNYCVIENKKYKLRGKKYAND